MDPVKKVLVIALDGATWDLLGPWLAGGAMPALAQLADAGRTGHLQSTLPPLTSPAWPSFMTGKQPANHGVFDFFQAGTRPGQIALIDSTHIRSRLFWEYLSAAGLRVGVLNVPATYPPRPVNGYLVPGLLAPDQGTTTYPPQLLHPYASDLGRYRLTPQMLYEPRKETEFATELREVTAAQIRYALRLARDIPTDFMMVHFLATDIAQHKLWHHLDPAHPWHDPARAHLGTIVRDLYTQIDAGLAQLLALMPEATVIVMSDHGFGPQTRTVNLNLYFAQRGLLTFKSGRRLRRLAWRHKWLTKIGQRWWGRERLLNWDDVDWSRTRAYSKGHMGQVWLNVPRHERAAARAQVATALRELRDPATGKRLVDQLIWQEEVAHGPYAQLGPDLHLIMDGYRALAYPMLAADGRVVTEQRRGDSGHHRPDGILIAAGPGIKPGGTVEGARLIDLAPTILHLQDVPLPDDMDGVVLQSLLANPANLRYQPAQTYESLSPPTARVEHEDMAVRLRALGYLEGGQ
mgnify:CR=1 FL=1